MSIEYLSGLVHTKRHTPQWRSTRTRMLGSSRSQRNDPNDARSVAVTALRQQSLQKVHCDGHARVLNSQRNVTAICRVYVCDPRDRGVTTSIPCPGRVYYDRKRAEGKNTKEALRALKRQISDVVYRTMISDTKAVKAGPGGQPGRTESPA
jgi:hypothetical protein